MNYPRKSRAARTYTSDSRHARFHRTTSPSPIDQKRLEGCLPDMLSDAIGFLDFRLMRRHRTHSLGPELGLEPPVQCLREPAEQDTDNFLATQMPRNCTLPAVPEPVRSAIEALWRLSMSDENAAWASGAFRLLENNCRSVYPEIKGSRLPRSASIFAPEHLRLTLRNFFRWNGAPWYGVHVPDADETSVKLHRTFLCERVRRTYLAPLDRLRLENRDFGDRDKVKNVSFGENEIACLDREELTQRLPVEGLNRFGPRYEFPMNDLVGRYWLMVSEVEEAGPVYRRTVYGLLDFSLDDLGTTEMFRSTFPRPVEDALFVLLLTFLKNPDETPWRPFGVPWTYSFTDDLFSDADPAPEALALTPSIVGDVDNFSEVPDQSEFFEMGSQQREILNDRWRKLQTVLTAGELGDSNFHPLTKHFFVKALGDNGIDEIISNISCLEATLRGKEEKNRHTRQTTRYKHLVENRESRRWIDTAYELRKHYLHSLGDPNRKITWKDLGQTRWAVATAVDKYLDLASRRPELGREILLKQIERPL